MELSLEHLFKLNNFSPNEQQLMAIKDLKNSLFIMAGPGSGKTRVLLWRTVNAIVFHNINPSEIFLSTFTEKAAQQLKEGLQNILAQITTITGNPYDLSNMYIGTIHSLCQRILSDRNFSSTAIRTRVPNLLDELDQYLFIRNEFIPYVYSEFEFEKGYLERELKELNDFRSHYDLSKHQLSLLLIKFFNRFSEELINPEVIRNFGKQHRKKNIDILGLLYEKYINYLASKNLIDFSLIQSKAYNLLTQKEYGSTPFKLIIIDEYQDSNSIQEKLFFFLARNNNICVVGDDDQSLYRFRGATVANFVEFKSRCIESINISPNVINLNINYRSKKEIVDFYKKFMDSENWKDPNSEKYFRLINKNIVSHNQDNSPAVFVTDSNQSYEHNAKEVAGVVKKLIENKKVADASQIAFLYPSLKNNPKVKEMIKALNELGLEVYAPRASKFLDNMEIKKMIGLIGHIIGFPMKQGNSKPNNFDTWLNQCSNEAIDLIRENKDITLFIDKLKKEISISQNDYEKLREFLEENSINLTDKFYYSKDVIDKILNNCTISDTAKNNLKSYRLKWISRKRESEGNPFSYHYIINRATSLNWNLLDLFYRLCQFDYFNQFFIEAEQRIDDEEIINLSKLTNYLSKFSENIKSIITGQNLQIFRLTDEEDNGIISRDISFKFFTQFLQGIYSLGESEVENKDIPFPRGKIPFLTIHQSKGLEFPYVILGRLGAYAHDVSFVEKLVRNLGANNNEPLNRITSFDHMRMFYVALSRAEQGILLMDFKKGSRDKIDINQAFFHLLNNNQYNQLSNLNIDNLPTVHYSKSILPKTYSYTSDFQFYTECPRRYMIFRKYDFIPSRTQTMVFGQLVHRTIEDLHNLILKTRG